MTMPVNEDLHVPKDVSDAASLATQLHEQLFPVETDTQDNEPEPPANPAPEPDKPAVPDANEEETFEKRYKTLEGKYKAEIPTMAAENRRLRQELEALRTPAREESAPQPKTNEQLEEILSKLKEEYPDELIENIRLLNRLEAKSIAEEAMRPILESNASREELKHQEEVTSFVTTITAAAPSWEKIWEVSSELSEGVEPSDPAIAAFLNSSDPSGLYTNMELLDMYNERFDAARFAKVCNMYQEPAAPQRNPSRDALLAPSRSQSQPHPQQQEVKLWTMQEIEQFQRDKRAEKYEPAQADAIWIDIQKALAEGRIR